MLIKSTVGNNGKRHSITLHVHCLVEQYRRLSRTSVKTASFKARSIVLLYSLLQYLLLLCKQANCLSSSIDWLTCSLQIPNFCSTFSDPCSLWLLINCFRFLKRGNKIILRLKRGTYSCRKFVLFQTYFRQSTSPLSKVKSFAISMQATLRPRLDIK